MLNLFYIHIHFFFNFSFQTKGSFTNRLQVKLDIAEPFTFNCCSNILIKRYFIYCICKDMMQLIKKTPHIVELSFLLK